MKKLFAVLLLLAAVPAWAASPWTVTNNASLDTKIGKLRVRDNKATCAHYGLGPSCTQGQARNKFCQRAGFPAAPCDGSGQVVIYADDATWVQDFWTLSIKAKAEELKQDTTATFDSAWLAAQTGPATTGQCSAFSLAPGCTLEAVACAAIGLVAPCRE